MQYSTGSKSVRRLICHYLPAALLALARANIPIAMEITSHASYTEGLALCRAGRVQWVSACVLVNVCAECAWIMFLCIIRSQTMWSVNRQRKKRLLINCHYQLFVSLSRLSGHAPYRFSCCVCVCTQRAQESWPKSTERWLSSGCPLVESPHCHHPTFREKIWLGASAVSKSVAFLPFNAWPG